MLDVLATLFLLCPLLSKSGASWLGRYLQMIVSVDHLPIRLDVQPICGSLFLEGHDAAALLHRRHMAMIGSSLEYLPPLLGFEDLLVV